jgi:hypothetical protein
VKGIMADKDDSDGGGESKGAAPRPQWKPLDPAGLKERLAQVRALLVQAAAVGLAQDVAHLERYTELDRRAKEAKRGPKDRRRYR